MTFPLDRRTEFQIGGVWTTVSGDVRESEPITIDRGTKSEAAKAAPSKCRLKLNNRHGKYSPRNPMSPYFGLIGRNTPMRVSVPGPESYLAVGGTTSSYARTPDTAALDITGDVDLRVEATTDWYSTVSQSLIGKWDSAANQRSYLLRILDGVLILNWSTAGSATLFAQVALPQLPKRAAVRATLDVNNGAAGFTATFYWAESLDGPWAQISSPLTSTPATSIHSGTAPLEVAPISANGVTPLAGRVHRAEVRSGIGGTVVASPDVRALAEGATEFTDSAGRVWTLGADAAISDREYRFHGEVSAWPNRWDVSGADVWVNIEAHGVLRRMGQGKKALDSTLRRRIPSAADLVAYWPMEEGQAAGVQVYSPTTGVQPLTLTGADWAADDTLGGSSALPKLTNPATMTARVPLAATVGWQVELVYNLPELPATQTEVLRISIAGATMRAVIVYASTAGIRIELRDDAGGILGSGTYVDAEAVANFAGGWNRIAIFSGDAGGGNTRVQATWRDVSSSTRYYVSTAPATGQGRVTAVSGAWGAATAGMGIGHLAVFSTPGSGVFGEAPTTTIFEGADDGFLGETALTRLARLATEEAAQVALTWIDGDITQSTERLGPQRPGTLLALFEEAAAADGGILYERLDRTALVYRDRASLYNQRVALALDYTAEGEVPPPLEPVPDDQRLRNDVTITRSGGSSGRAVLDEGPLSVQPPPDGVGPYDEALTLSLYTDDQPARIAQWRMHLGTWDEERYPTITVWLHAAPHLIDAVLAMDIGDRLTIDNTPPWLPPGLIDQHMRGYTETLGLFTWTLAANCSPAGPWTVGVLADPVLSRADTAGSELAAAVTVAETFLSVATTAGPLWVSDPVDLPFDVTVGGEVVTVTDITGARGDRFDRAVADGWGTATSGQAWTTSGGTASDYSVQGG